MLDHVFASLMGGERDIPVERRTSTTSGGRPVITYAAPVTYKVRTIIDGPNKQVLHEDAGSQKLLDRSFYFHGIVEIFNLDRATYENVRYELRGVEKRPEGNFTYAFGKAVERLPDLETGSD
jgi:hypothetical protein